MHFSKPQHHRTPRYTQEEALKTADRLGIPYVKNGGDIIFKPFMRRQTRIHQRNAKDICPPEVGQMFRHVEADIRRNLQIQSQSTQTQTAQFVAQANTPLDRYHSLKAAGIPHRHFSPPITIAPTRVPPPTVSTPTPRQRLLTLLGHKDPAP